MEKTKIPYQETGYFSELILDYLSEKEELRDFYNHLPKIESFQNIIEERKKTPLDRKGLVDALDRQYETVSTSEEVNINVQKLNNDNCFTVTTGHQLNLMTGPLYFIYKIVSTINLAKELKLKYPDNDFVPVYWMATEDHDFDEINHFNLFNKKYQLSNTQSGAVGSLKLEGIDELLADLVEGLTGRNGAKEIIDFFSKYYKSSKTFASATKGIVNELFGKYGLVIIDGDDRNLKKMFVDELKSELLNKTNHQTINITSKKLKELGYKTQLTPREINIFYLIDGIRERIVFQEGKYKVLNTGIEFSEAEVLKELECFPERFSPNAPLRCMYQEKILPNLAYVGGGGELAYWLQLKETFDSNRISYPILVLRNSVLFVDLGSHKKLSKLDFNISDLFSDELALIKKYLKNNTDITLDLKKEELEFNNLFEGIVKKAGQIDQSLQPFVEAELQKSIKSLKNIEKRLLKAEKKKEEIAVNQIKNLRGKLFPNDSLQERHDNLISILLFYGEHVIDELIKHQDPLAKEFIVLTPN